MSHPWLTADLYWVETKRTEAELISISFVGPNWIRLVIGEDAVLTVDAKELEQALAEARAEESGEAA